MDYEKVVKSVLRSLGVGKNYTGYDYTVYGMLLVFEDRERLTYITKLLYPEISRKYHTSWKCVERDIRTVVKIAWEDGDEKFLRAFCGGEIIPKPKNAQFFAMMYDYLTSQSYEPAVGMMAACSCEQVCLSDKEQFSELKVEIREMEKQIQRLNETVDWMHKLIWELLKVIRSMTCAGQIQKEKDKLINHHNDLKSIRKDYE